MKSLWLIPSGVLLLQLAVACTAPPVAVRSPSLSPNPGIPAQARVKRVVALTSLSADITHRLAPDRLVGIPGNRLLAQRPEFRHLPSVSQGQTPPNLEKIVALKPDLVIGATGFHDRLLERLQALGIRTQTTQVTSWRSLQDLTRTLAADLQVDPTSLLQSYQALIKPPSGNAGSTLVLVSYQPILAPNKTSWAGDLLAQFQIKNLVADLQGASPQAGYITLSPEKILTANPDILILVDIGDGTLEKLKADPFWKQLKAVENQRVYVFDYYGLVNPGSLDAIARACQQLQGLLAPAPNP